MSREQSIDTTVTAVPLCIGAAAGHLTGYVGEITAEELGSEAFPDSVYEGGMIVGKVTNQKFCSREAPSTTAASVSSLGTVVTAE